MTQIAPTDPQIPVDFRRDQWDRRPFNCWSFQNIAAFLRTEQIAPAETITDLPLSATSLEGFVVTRGAVQTPLSDYLAQNYVDGFLVLLDGAIAYEGYWNGMRPQTPHLLQSMSKSITSIALGRLIEDGLVNPDARIATYLPELSVTAWQHATLRQVLDMCTGLVYTEDYDVPDSDMGITDYATGWKPLPAGIAPGSWPGSIWDQILSLSRRVEPGEFHYASIETEVLGCLIERVTGRTLAQVIAAYVWQPIGAELPASITLDPKGTASASGGISCTLRDLGRFGQAILQDGIVAGNQVLPRDFIQDIKCGGRVPLTADYHSLLPKGGYRSQFWIEDMAKENLYCLGIFGQMLYIAPKSKLVIAQLSSQPSPLDPKLAADQMALVRQIAARSLAF